MRTLKHARDLAEEIRRLCCGLFMAASGRFDYALEDYDEDGVGVHFDWCSVHLGHRVEIEEFQGVRKLNGYRVWVDTLIAGGRWEPDEIEDVTVVETISRNEVIRAVLREYVDAYLDEDRYGNHAAEYNREKEE